MKINIISFDAHNSICPVHRLGHRCNFISQNIYTYEQDYSAGIWMAIRYEELFDSAMPYDDFVPTEGRSALQNGACPKMVPQLPAAVWGASLID